jgi:hypothetical protein
MLDEIVKIIGISEKGFLIVEKDGIQREITAGEINVCI